MFESWAKFQKKKKNQLTKVLSLNSIKIKLQEKRKTDK